MAWVGRRTGEFPGLAGLDWARTDGRGSFLLLSLYSLGRIWASGILQIAVAFFSNPLRLRDNFSGTGPHATCKGLRRARGHCSCVVKQGRRRLRCVSIPIYPMGSHKQGEEETELILILIPIPLDPTVPSRRPPAQPQPHPHTHLHPRPAFMPPAYPSINQHPPLRIRRVALKPHRNEHVTHPAPRLHAPSRGSSQGVKRTCPTFLRRSLPP